MVPAAADAPVGLLQSHRPVKRRRTGAPYTMDWDGEDNTSVEHEERRTIQRPARRRQHSSSPDPSGSSSGRASASTTTVSADYLVNTRPYSREFGTGLVYDERMLMHDIPGPISHPEAPDRIEAIFKLLNRSGCTMRMRRIAIREATKEEVLTVHDEGVWNGVEMSAFFPHKTLARRTPLLEAVSSLYLNEYSALCTRLACGGTIELCDAVASRRIKNGFAVVRPPGHHAEPHHSMGFCFYNNVAVAVKTLRQRYPHGPNAVKRVLILDWDVHHGNGTQRAFWDDENTLYISLHRYENGEYYPGGTYGANDTVGPVGHPAQGTTVNIGWPTIGMGDADYLHAFREVVMPVAREFSPDFVIISAGFDAAEGDQYGECCVTPRGYAHMTHMLSSLANGRMAVVLEGGYNVQASAAAALEVTKVILGEDPPAYLRGPIAGVVSRDTVAEVQRIQSRYWRCLRRPSLSPPVEVDAFSDLEPSRTRQGMPSIPSAEPKPLLTPFYHASAAWRTAHLRQKFDMVRLPLVSFGGNLQPGFSDANGRDSNPEGGNDTSSGLEDLEGSVHVSRNIFEKNFSTIVVVVHDAGTIRADQEEASMIGPDLDTGDYEVDDFEEVVAEAQALRTMTNMSPSKSGGNDTVPSGTQDLAGDENSRRRFARAYTRLSSSRDDWSSYMIDSTDAMLSWAAFEGRHGVIDIVLPTHISLSLRTGRQKDVYSGPVNPKLSRTGAQYLEKIWKRIDSLLLHVWDNCVRLCPGPVAASADYNSPLRPRPSGFSNFSTSGSSSASDPMNDRWDASLGASHVRSAAGPDVVFIGQGPGCEAVLRLVSRRALHLDADLLKHQDLTSLSAELGVPHSPMTVGIPVVRAIVQVYGYEDLALAPKLASPDPTPTPFIGASPRGHPATPSAAALAASASEGVTSSAATAAQYANQPGGVGLKIAAQRLGLPLATGEDISGSNEPQINPGAMPMMSEHSLENTEPGASAIAAPGLDQNDGNGEEEKIFGRLRAGPELRKWYANNSKVILPKDHPYYRWKLETKVRRTGGDISKRPNESDPLKLMSYAMPGIVSFLEGRVRPEPDEEQQGIGRARVLVEDSHAQQTSANINNSDEAVSTKLPPPEAGHTSKSDPSDTFSTQADVSQAVEGGSVRDWVGAAPPSLPFTSSLSSSGSGGNRVEAL
ncbi:Histone deacetylase hda1 [Tilletia horrida]|uniref:histone deacetylase n=1 Tax=Tilletia horrida TaxID=155126 RepID=A0AAN6JQZ9_9BASI|nr:Histone deacetylase hda1 [Tilletia horrida]KAK0550078.1 Histone deacetylase hda1 [Tilletia horrida]KAK0565098.1 Histone deacetylase hda1 [Tilletia horrida]